MHLQHHTAYGSIQFILRQCIRMIEKSSTTWHINNWLRQKKNYFYYFNLFVVPELLRSVCSSDSSMHCTADHMANGAVLLQRYGTHDTRQYVPYTEQKCWKTTANVHFLPAEISLSVLSSSRNSYGRTQRFENGKREEKNKKCSRSLYWFDCCTCWTWQNSITVDHCSY